MKGTKEATSAWRKGQNLMTKITTLIGKRLDHFAKLIQLTRQSLRAENAKLQILEREAHTTLKVIAVTIQVIHMSIIHLYEINSIYTALHELSKAGLSHHLVNGTSLTAGLRDMSESLQRSFPEFDLIYKDANYYYTQAKVGGAIHKDGNAHILLIIIQAPIALKTAIAPLTVWEFTYFPLRSPDNQEFYSILYNAPKYIAYSEDNPFYFTANDANDLPFRMGEHMEKTHFVRMSDNNLRLHTKNKLTCAIALMIGSLLDVKSLCELHLLYRSLIPAVYRISDGKLLVSNISTVKIVRKGDNFFRPDVKPIHKILQNHSPQWILSLPCESQAIINDVVYFTGKHCNPQIAEYDINISYPINIMVLKHYFSDHTLLSDLNSALELNQSLFAELPPLLVQDDQYDRILAKEKETRFDFNAALNSSIQQEKMYSDLSNVLFEKIVNIGSSVRSFNPFRPET